jgi:glycosyltransferase involved in cell wall biosynthesis
MPLPGIRAVVRILHVSKKFPPVVGGDATAVSALASAQSRKGHDVHVLVYRADGLQATERVHPVGPVQTPEGLDRVGLRRVRGMRAMRAWAHEHLASLRPDLVHAHAVDVGASVAGIARSQGIPVVLTCHGLWFPNRPRWSPLGWLERSLLRRGYDAITTVDRASAKELRDLGWSNAIVVPNGVDLSEFIGSDSHDGTTRILFVGRHVYQKGIDVLLEAAALVRSRIAEPFVLELAGDGPERSRMERRAMDLGLGDVARFLGSLSRPDLLRAYHRATAFVLPSRFEGFPLVILEAWAASLPVIATAVGGVPDLCDKGNAWLVPPESPTALADAIVSLALDPARRRELGTRGRAAVQGRYTWEVIAYAYEEVYASCRRQTSDVGP